MKRAILKYYFKQVGNIKIDPEIISHLAIMVIGKQSIHHPERIPLNFATKSCQVLILKIRNEIVWWLELNVYAKINRVFKFFTESILLDSVMWTFFDEAAISAAWNATPLDCMLPRCRLRTRPMPIILSLINSINNLHKQNITYLRHQFKISLVLFSGPSALSA